MADELDVNPLFVREELQPIPRERLGARGLDADVALQVVRDEAMLDGNPRQNLATFVTTWMEPAAQELAALAADRNLVDRDEYPRVAEIERRCVAMLAELWHAPDPAQAIGVSTAGSSEACMLAGLAMKRRWQHARRGAGQDTDRPNLVMSAGVQVVWEKFADYWDVEPRLVPVTDESPCLQPDGMLAAIDERTIGVVGILGATHTGIYEPIAALADALDDLQARTGQDVPLHVDAASGGFVAPFLQPELRWDLQLDRVASINASGHKYGLVYPGIGWALWRDASAVPDDLVFHVDYLGGDTSTLGLNFSRSGAPVLLQYFTFLRLGLDGYRRTHQLAQDVAMRIAEVVRSTSRFRILGDGTDLPVVAWTQDPPADNWTLFDLSALLRQRGWLVPAYHLPADLEEVAVMRVVVRNGFTHDLAEALLADVTDAVDWLEALDVPLPSPPDAKPAFHH